MTLIDLTTAKLHLRLDSDDEDALVQLYVSAASAAAINFLNRNVYASLDELESAAEPPDANPMVINDAVRAAVLLILGHLYANREEVVLASATQMPFGAHNLLYPYRIGMGV